MKTQHFELIRSQNSMHDILKAMIVGIFVALGSAGAKAQTLYVPGGSGGIGTSTQAGSVGIATNNPQSVLHVSAGSGRAIFEVGSNSILSPLNLWNSNTGATAGAGLLITAGSSPTAGFIGGLASQRIDAASNSRSSLRVLSNGSLSGGDASAVFYLEGSAAGPKIIANGNVGIGTTNPQATLEIVKDADSQLRIGEHPSYPSYSALWSGGEDYTILKDANHLFLNARGTGNIYFRQDNSDLATILNNGNVGIGTAWPNYRLEVFGPAGNYPLRLETPDGYLVLGPANSSWCHFATDRTRFYFSTGITVDSGAVGSYDEDLLLQTAGTTRVTVSNSTGNVGIGTTNPGTNKLSVNGTIRAKEVIVEASPWPDDVFAAGYELPTLESVKTHIAERGHLPGVPSAAAVAEQGVTLGEMQATLLRKIEEMTLHMIQQQKEIQDLRTRITELEGAK